MAEDKKTYIKDPNYFKQFSCNSAVIGALAGVTARSIQGLNSEGVVKAEEGSKGYDLITAMNSYCEHLRNRAAGRAATDKETELKQKKLEAEIALKESQGELHRLKTDIAAGKYVAVEDVKLDYDRFFLIFKKFALAIPNRVAVLVNGYVDPLTVRAIEKDISKEVSSMLNAFISSAIEDKKEESSENE